MYDTVFYNGQFDNINDVHLSINDRGFLYGHSVYESFCIINRRLILFTEHINRLNQGLMGLSIPVIFDHSDFEKIVYQLCEINNVDHYVKCYIQVTAGDTDFRNYTDFNQPNVLVRLYEWNGHKSTNYKAILMNDLRWGMCHIKSNSLAYNAIAGKKANENDAIEVIFIKDNYVQECSTSNVFICQENKLYTPDVSQQLLNGVTRQWIINKALELDIEVIEKKLHVDELIHADEVFITASFKGVHPITCVNNKIYNNNKIGPITKLLKDAYQNANFELCTH